MPKAETLRTWHAEKKAALGKMAADVEEEYERRTREIESETANLQTAIDAELQARFAAEPE